MIILLVYNIEYFLKWHSILAAVGVKDSQNLKKMMYTTKKKKKNHGIESNQAEKDQRMYSQHNNQNCPVASLKL